MLFDALLVIGSAGAAVLGLLAIAAKVDHDRYYGRTGRGRHRC